MGFLDDIKKVVPAQGGGNGQNLGNAAAGALGSIFGGKVNEAAQGPASAVTGWINGAAATVGNAAKVTGAKTILATQYPEAMPLGQSPKMNTFVESGLRALDHFKGTPDGKPGADTLAGINKVREVDGKPPLTDVNQVTRDDVGSMVQQLAQKSTPAATNVLDGAVSTLSNLKGDYPKPEAPAAAPVQRNDPSMGG